MVQKNAVTMKTIDSKSAIPKFKSTNKTSRSPKKKKKPPQLDNQNPNVKAWCQFNQSIGTSPEDRTKCYSPSIELSQESGERPVRKLKMDTYIGEP